MARLRRHLTLALALLSTEACVSGKPVLEVQQSPTVDTSVVFPLPIPSGGQMRWPTAAWFDNGWVIAANVFPYGTNALVNHRALYLVHSRTGFLPLPDGDFLFAYPLVTSTPAGTLHLFWSEGPASLSPPGWPYTFTAIWHATYAHGRWNTPERVVRAAWLSWDSRAPQVVADDRGRLHMVLAAADSGRPDEIYHLMHDITGWHKQSTGEHGLYPALASLSRGRLMMVLVMSDTNARSSQLYSRASYDYGKTWSRPARVLPSADTSAAFKTQLRVVGDSLYLSWIGEPTAEGEIWRLSRLKVTRDSFVDNWTSATRSPPFAGVLINVTFAEHGCGHIRALAELLTPAMQPVVRELRVLGDQVLVESPFGDAIAGAPFTDRKDNRIIQLWNGVRAAGDSVQPFFREFSMCH
jgi:hypothetical protein